MKTYCKSCLKKMKDGLLVCPSCGEKVVTELQEEEIRPIAQSLHKKTNVYRERVSTGLSLFVIGLTLVIIGALFYRLSFKLDQENVEETVFSLATNSAEFWVSMICLVGGAISTLFGASWAIVWSFLRREAYHDVDEIRASRSLRVNRTPTIFEIWGKKISYRIRQTIFSIKRKSAEKKAEGK